MMRAAIVTKVFSRYIPSFILLLFLKMILVCAEQETSHLKGKEHELVISNARSDADHLVELRVTSTQRMAESSVLDAHTSEAQESNSYRHYVASTTERDGGANARKIESREA